jgi:hypothetical protein
MVRELLSVMVRSKCYEQEHFIEARHQLSTPLGAGEEGA